MVAERGFFHLKRQSGFLVSEQDREIRDLTAVG
jgi:hypothetical protein